MTTEEKKPKETIVITKRNLYLIIFLAIITLVVAIAVPATIHLKQQRGGGNDNPDKPISTSKQIGEDGIFFSVFEEDETSYPPIYYPEDYTKKEGTEAVTDCINLDEPDSKAISDPESAFNKCMTLRIVRGTEEEYQGAIITDVSDFYYYFNRRDSRFDQEFFKHNRLVVVITHMDYCGGKIDRVYLMGTEGSTTATPTIEFESSCGPCADEMSVYLITISDKEIVDDIVEPKYIDKAVNNCDPYVSYKPVIYLYPTTTTDVDVELGAPEKLLVSYPKYHDVWRVTANPDGLLVDRTTGRSLYSLYYEADNTVSKGVHEDGFVVKGSETASFLEEKLAQLGLNDREAEEFIIYWLPKLEGNAYNYIYFDTVVENMPLKVSPAPDAVIRFNMEYKALDAPIQVKIQQLPETPIRQGFTLVEWGGTIL